LMSIIGTIRIRRDDWFNRLLKKASA
jgi:hypothetical protein